MDVLLKFAGEFIDWNQSAGVMLRIAVILLVAWGGLLLSRRVIPALEWQMHRRARDPEQIKREGWRDQQILVISPDDTRLDWVERELLRRIGDRLYGSKERRHG